MFRIHSSGTHKMLRPLSHLHGTGRGSLRICKYIFCRRKAARLSLRKVLRNIYVLNAVSAVPSRSLRHICGFLRSSAAVEPRLEPHKRERNMIRWRHLLLSYRIEMIAITRPPRAEAFSGPDARQVKRQREEIFDAGQTMSANLLRVTLYDRARCRCSRL